MRTLDPANTRPAYVQIGDALREAIAAGEYEPGQQLPSRAELLEHFGVARQTLQQALRVLHEEGVVTGVQGKGMYVGQVPAEQDTVSYRPVVLRMWSCGSCGALVDDKDKHAEWHNTREATE